ncbi:MAG: hypothetical protein COW65_18660 [Cytophagales bacterium CG18_big_fil_WC_8_21_14_2_50_42_9]|nr:MAG: hypothetical protein COW65_18660 [Cytophagales bacterium CG18_big_fil_WC_8_21_14_2_50_42_9]
MNRLICFIGVFLWFAPMGFGQQFQYEAELGPVATDSFYKIQLTPAVITHLQNSFADIRLYDGKKQEVPYLLRREQPVQTRKLFRRYEVVSKTSTPGVGTTLILRNPNPSPINNISLIIKNANVRKQARLSGSSDARTWYNIEDNFRLQAIYNNTATTEVKILYFPLSDYRYYKLDINDSASAPLNILSAGYYDTSAENGKYTTLPQVKFRQTDSSAVKQTIIRFEVPTPMLADKISLAVSSPAFYHRQATLFRSQTRKKKRRRRPYKTYEPVVTFQLQSDSENSFALPNFKAADFYLVIDNQDSPPLQVKDIRFQLLNTYLVAALQKGQPYYLQYGNATAEAPTYDLTYFKENIPSLLPTISPGKVTALSHPDKTQPISFFQNKNIIWATIILVIGLLGFLTYQMLRETKKR